jgi:sterol desaturase/sphingolipid hydroxylase (fatty acid hydroxylase superfamily)
LFTQLAMNLPALVLGLELSGLAWLIVFRGVWAAFIHSNGTAVPARSARAQLTADVSRSRREMAG